MYCISRDKERSIEAKGFSIAKNTNVVRYYREGQYKFNLYKHTAEPIPMYCIFTNNKYFMDAFFSKEEALEKLKEVNRALFEGVDLFEF